MLVLRQDPQERDDFAGGGQAVSDEAVVTELEAVLDAYTGRAQHLDGGPGPKRVVFCTSSRRRPSAGSCAQTLPAPERGRRLSAPA